MTRARDLSNDQANTGGAIAPVVAGKNAVINGGFDIWQRGTSRVPDTSVSFYATDRWVGYRSVLGSTISRQSTNDTTNLPNIQYCARVQRDSGNTSTAEIWLVQSLETANSIPFAGKTATVSFWARKGANFSAPTFRVDFNYGTGTDQNIVSTYTGYGTVNSSGITPTTTWTKYSVTGTVPTNATELAFGFYWAPSGTAGAADYFEVTGVQMEIGSSATPFSRNGATIQGELAACQRYYQRFISGGSYGIFGFGKAYATNEVQTFIPLKQTMRTIPYSLDTSGASTFMLETGATGVTAITSITLNSALTNTDQIGISSVKTGAFTTAAAYSLIANNSTTSYLGVSAEL